MSRERLVFRRPITVLVFACIVSSAVLTEPVYPSYDQQLLQAAKGWRYKPAQRAGQAVKYRRGLSIVLAPPPG